MKQYTPNDWPTQIKKSDSIEKTDKKCFQDHFSMFQLGYQDAIILDWSKLSKNEAIRLAFGYTQTAMKKRNAYLIGYACGVQDAVRRVAQMARRDTSTDFRDSKQFDVSITRTGNVVSVEITTENSKEEWVLDFADFVELIAEGSLILNKKKGVA